jgi:hypothetical protein
MKKRTAIISVSILICVVLMLAGVELIAHATLPQPLSFRAAMELRPPPYQNSTYWSPEFVQERFEVAGKLNLGSEGFTTLDYSGQYYNVVNGQRVTTGQPSNYTNTIYLTGASNIFDIEVPDNYTIASQIQAIVGEEYRVENLGVIAMGNHQIAQRIRSLSLIPGDIVILYEGWNDYKGVIPKIVDAHKTPLCRMLEATFFVRRSLALKTVCRWNAVIEPSDQQFIDQLREDIITTIQSAEAYTEEAGAEFLYVLPPFLLTKPGLSDYETHLLTDMDTMTREFAAFGPQIPLIDLSPLDPLNLQHLLDDEDNVFVSHYHVNERGDSLIAQAIVDQFMNNTE